VDHTPGLNRITSDQGADGIETVEKKMRLKLLPQFIQFGVPAEFFCVILALTVFLFFFLGIPEYTQDSHTHGHQKSDAQADQVCVGEEDQVTRIIGIRQDQVQNKFAETIGNQAEDEAEEKHIPILVSIWKVIAENIADDPAGSHQQAISYQAVCDGRFGRISVARDKQGVQGAPNYPPDKKSGAKSADTKRRPCQSIGLNDFEKLVPAVVQNMCCFAVGQFDIEVSVVCFLDP